MKKEWKIVNCQEAFKAFCIQFQNISEDVDDGCALPEINHTYNGQAPDPGVLKFGEPLLPIEGPPMMQAWHMYRPMKASIDQWW